MAGRGLAAKNGKDLELLVQELAENLGLVVRSQFVLGKRIWGSRRFIDLIVGDKTGRRLGIECKFQQSGGTAEEKIPATLRDIEAWPIDGLVVYHGDGFSENMKAFLLSTGKAIPFEDLRNWLILYFGLDFDA